MSEAIHIHRDDNVAVALQPLPAGASVLGVSLREDIPQGHKFALVPVNAGQPVIKYGAPIGVAKVAIAPGDHVHEHNLKTALSGLEAYRYDGVPAVSAPGAGAVPQIEVFQRKNGDIGIRNDLWILPLVGCVNGLASTLARKVEAEGLLPPGSRVQVLSHPYGCSQLGGDLDNTRAILRNYAVHPNAGGVLVLGLGCENNTLVAFRDGFVVPDPDRIRFLVTQDVSDELAAGLAACRELTAVMQADRRVAVSACRLRVGLKCGGSDGLSGITANPLLGAFSDWLTAIGGTTVLTEVPEMFGAEHLLMARAESRAVFDKTVALINDFKQYYIDHDQPVSENPSPGNRAGGITTLEEKSLGCVQKGGHALVRDVLGYTGRLAMAGLNLLSAPGNDGVAVTALAAAGCHMVLFTTGRGTPLGGVVPTMKIATNTALAEKKPHWIDFNAGPIAEGVAIAGLNQRFIEAVLAVASGAPTRNESNGIGEIAIFKTGVTL